MMVASQEIAASTAQLVIASRVKAKEGSNRFNELRLASRVVTEATGRVVAVAKDRSVTADSELLSILFWSKSFKLTHSDVELDFSQLSAHQSKTLEMETQVRLLKLESEVEKERKRLAELRRRHYHGKEGPEQ
jgi:huntingtin interacting protein 1